MFSAIKFRRFYWIARVKDKGRKKMRDVMKYVLFDYIFLNFISSITYWI